MSSIAARTMVPRLPTGPGVYRFVDERGRKLYVGRAVNLRRRVASYWGDLKGRRHLRRMVARITRIDALTCDSGHEAAWLERNVLERALPPWNRVVGGMEVPLSIVVDLDPPALRAVHDAQPSEFTFGPYLGGNQVRLAISGLQRIFPLHYAARLTASAQDLASVRGFAVTSAVDLTASVIAVLGRDASAVKALIDSLTARRDTAAASLAFELAARIQAEIEAIEWIAEDQKVNHAGGPDLVAHGYADGFLLTLQVHAGRLDNWSVRPASAKTAQPLVAATSAHWHAYAQRNAQLAAALRA